MHRRYWFLSISSPSTARNTRRVRAIHARSNAIDPMKRIWLQRQWERKNKHRVVVSLIESFDWQNPTSVFVTISNYDEFNSTDRLSGGKHEEYPKDCHWLFLTYRWSECYAGIFQFPNQRRCSCSRRRTRWNRTRSDRPCISINSNRKQRSPISTLPSIARWTEISSKANEFPRLSRGIRSNIGKIRLSFISSSIVCHTWQQEADAAGQRRSTDSHVDFSNDPERLLIEGLTPREAKSLGAAERRSIAARGQRASNAAFQADRSRAQSMQPNMQMRSNSQTSNSGVTTSAKPHTLVAQLSGLFWAFVAAYAFTTILFLTKLFGVDLLFGFFVQVIVQTAAFATYAFYKNYHLLGPLEFRGLMIARALFMSIGTLASFLAYYYISLADLSAIRQSQVVFSIVLSIFFLHERVTIVRILGFILTLIGIVVLFRPTSFSAASSAVVNLTDPSTTWIPHFSSWNHVVGIALALCAALMFSIASIIARMHTSTERLHNSVLCFWSSCFGLILSLILMSVSYYLVPQTRFVAYDWRLLVAVGLALASIFVFIANQKAIKRLQPSIVTLIYASDIIFAFILETFFTQIRSDLVLILGENALDSITQTCPFLLRCRFRWSVDLGVSCDSLHWSVLRRETQEIGGEESGTSSGEQITSVRSGRSTSFEAFVSVNARWASSFVSIASFPRLVSSSFEKIK